MAILWNWNWNPERTVSEHVIVETLKYGDIRDDGAEVSDFAGTESQRHQRISGVATDFLQQDIVDSHQSHQLHLAWLYA